MQGKETLTICSSGWMSTIKGYGRTKVEAIIKKKTMDLHDKAEMENQEAAAAQMKALQDYNIMLGILEDPAETEEDE